MMYFFRYMIFLKVFFFFLFWGEVASWGKAVDIWGIGGSYKVDPLEGSVLGLDWKHSEQYMKSNELWEGEKRKIAIKGAKNEVLSFQIIFERKEESVRNIQIEEKKIKGPTSDSNLMFYFFLEGYSKIGENGKWIPDLLIPFNVSGAHPFSIPHRMDSLSNIPGQKIQGVWVDVRIPQKAKDGIYHYDLILKIDDHQQEKIRIEIEVINLTLPLRQSFGIDLNDYGPKYLKDWSDAESEQKLRRIEKEFYRMAHSHGAVLNILPYKSQLGYPWPGLAPQVEGVGGDKRITKWDEYDERMGPFFDGSAFDNGIPISHHYLPFNPEWPSDFSLYFSNREKYEAEWKAIAKEFVEHAKQKGWDQTLFQIYLNQKPQKNNRIPWNLDEPKGVDDYKALRFFADLTHDSFIGSFSKFFQFRIDISHFYCERHQGDPKKDFRVNGGFEILHPVDIWVISSHSLPSQVASRKARKLQREGKQVWQYGNAPLINQSLFLIYNKIWKGWIEKWDGVLFWKTITTDLNQGDGRKFLIYSGAPLGYEGPLPSMRLKALRQGVYDHQYMEMIENFNPKKRKWIESLVQPNFSERHVEIRELLRKEALSLVSKKKKL